MPKIVDHDSRRQLIAEAFVAVARRDGVAAASVRSVAAEAGLSPSALRHYFSSQPGLVLFVAETITGAVADRCRGALAEAADLDGALLALDELLPLDERRLGEYDVWHAMVVGSRGDAALARLSDESWDGIRRVCRLVLQRAGVPDARLDAETRALHGLVDGLALHLSLYPDRVAPAEVTAAVRAHVSALGRATRRAG